MQFQPRSSDRAGGWVGGRAEERSTRLLAQTWSVKHPVDLRVCICSSPMRFEALVLVEYSCPCVCVGSCFNPRDALVLVGHSCSCISVKSSPHPCNVLVLVECLCPCVRVKSLPNPPVPVFASSPRVPVFVSNPPVIRVLFASRPATSCCLHVAQVVN